MATVKKNRRWFVVVATAMAVIFVLTYASRRNLNGASTWSDPIQRGSIIESVYGIGTVTARKSFQLKLGVTSTVLKLYVKEGDKIRRGQKLVDLDGTGEFTAPFDGTITYLPVRVGETVFPQSIILSVVDLLDRYIVVSLEQKGALKVRQGQKARISFDSMRDDVFEGVVESVYSFENAFLVRIGVSNLPPQILPGMTGDVAIGIVEHTNVLLVPVAAIDSGKVYIQKGNKKPTPIEVKTGIVDSVMAEITAGDLREGQRLLIPTKNEVK